LDSLPIIAGTVLLGGLLEDYHQEESKIASH
jgi:hypothetical protein